MAKNSKGKNISKSKATKTKAFDKQTRYFSGYQNIYITKNKASNKKMDKFILNDGVTSSVKYNYSINRKMLYIHLYLNILDKTNGANFKLYKNRKVKKTINKKYKTILMEGITKNWKLSIKGNKYDFAPGVNFKTKVIIHQKSTNNMQNYITVHLGDKSKSAKFEGKYWFFANSIRYNNNYNHIGNCSVYIPTQDLLSKNSDASYGPESSLKYFEDTIAHEIGHAMGLNDGYDTKKGTRRSDTSTEIGHVKDNVSYHIMNNGKRQFADVFPNDVEMIIKAQEEALHNKNSSFQSYKNYTEDDGTKFKKSKVIRK